MLQPEYLRNITEKAGTAASRLELQVIKAIVERIVERLKRDEGEDLLTSVDYIMTQVLMDAGIVLEDVSALVAQALPQIKAEIQQAFKEGMEKSWQYDSSVFGNAGIPKDSLGMTPYYTAMIQRDYASIMVDMDNLTGTIADRAQVQFIQAASAALLKTQSGAFSYSQAMRDAVKSLSTSGISLVTYPSGHVDTIETATLRAIRTGISQTAAQITQERMSEYDYDLVLVSQHIGARPSHAQWQGKMYSMFGKTPGYALLSEATGYGTVTGLCGANCRHSFGPAIEGYNPYESIDRKKSDAVYETIQTQRQYEREIRADKREVLILRSAMDQYEEGTEGYERLQKDYQRASAKLQRHNERLNAWIEENELKQRPASVYVGGWTRSQASKASAAARKYNARTGGEKK